MIFMCVCVCVCPSVAYSRITMLGINTKWQITRETRTNGTNDKQKSDKVFDLILKLCVRARDCPPQSVHRNHWNVNERENNNNSNKNHWSFRWHIHTRTQTYTFVSAQYILTAGEINWMQWFSRPGLSWNAIRVGQLNEYKLLHISNDNSPNDMHIWMPRFSHKCRIKMTLPW